MSLIGINDNADKLTLSFCGKTWEGHVFNIFFYRDTNFVKMLFKGLSL